MVLTPLGYWMKLLSDNFSVELFHAGLNVALWSPVGAPFGVVVSLLEGAWGAAGIRALATLADGWLSWLACSGWPCLASVMSGYAGEISADAQSAIDEGRHLIDESAEEDARGQRTAQSRAAACAASHLHAPRPRRALGVVWRRARCATGSWIRAST